MPNSVRIPAPEIPLDEIDAEIIRLLQKNARMPNKELAARVGLAPSSALERVRRLMSSGVLRGFHAAVDPRRVGVGLQALVAVWLTRHSRQIVDTFRAYVLTVPEVIAVFHTAGRTDFLLHVAVRDADHLRELGLSAFTTRKEVAHIETSLLFEYYRSGALPIYAPVPASPPRRRRPE